MWIWLLLVAVIWGSTNVLMKLGSVGVTTLPKRSNAIYQMISEFVFLFTRPSYLLPFVANIGGSVLFYYALSQADVTLVVPIVNSLTFIFTSFTAKLMGEEDLSIGAHNP
jgi:uncharacterized membrane protein